MKLGQTSLAKRLLGLAVVIVAVDGLWAHDAFGDAAAGDGGGTISVGVSTGTSAAGSAGTPVVASGGEGGSACSYVLLPPADQALLGIGGQQPGSWYLKECPGESANSIGSVVVWIPGQSSSGGTAPTPLEAVALEAERSMNLPAPKAFVNPSPRAVVNLPEWLWIDPTIWHDVSVTATTGGISATATALPSTVTWAMGDGSTIVCDGPGTPFLAQQPVGSQTTACSYTYRQSSFGQPAPDGNPNDAAFQVTATISWDVTWQAVGAAGGGALPGLTTSETFALPVQQIESVNVR